MRFFLDRNEEWEWAAESTIMARHKFGSDPQSRFVITRPIHRNLFALTLTFNLHTLPSCGSGIYASDETEWHTQPCSFLKWVYMTKYTNADGQKRNKLETSKLCGSAQMQEIELIYIPQLAVDQHRCKASQEHNGNKADASTVRKEGSKPWWTDQRRSSLWDRTD